MRLTLLTLTALLISTLLPAQAQVPLDVGPLEHHRVLAHRGASAYAPEHTFYAYDLAIEQDTDFLECDAQLTADGYLVCLHNSTLNKVTDGQSTARPGELTLSELRDLEYGSWKGEEFTGAAIVPLEEQIDCYRHHNAGITFHIETKGAGTEEELIRILAERDLIPAEGTGSVTDDQVLVQSFSIDSLNRIEELAPAMATVFLGIGDRAAMGLPPEGIDGISPNGSAILADPLLPARFHANGYEVHTYTVNNAVQMGLLLDLGVDAIFTDQPDTLRAEIDRRGTGVPADERGNPATLAFDLCEGFAGWVGVDLDGDGEDEVDGSGAGYPRTNPAHPINRMG